MIAAVLLAGALATWVLVARAIVRYDQVGPDDVEGLVLAVLMGLCAATVWPLVLVSAVVGHLVRNGMQR